MAFCHYAISTQSSLPCGPYLDVSLLSIQHLDDTSIEDFFFCVESDNHHNRKLSVLFCQSKPCTLSVYWSLLIPACLST
jgi:hypothetical protein